jgi:hypothetical protein
MEGSIHAQNALTTRVRTAHQAISNTRVPFFMKGGMTGLLMTLGSALSKRPGTKHQ